jgi:uncharacterized protein
MKCNKCGACCIAPSISSIIPGTDKNKPAGTRCTHLSDDMKCSIYHTRPAVCSNFTPTDELCGKNYHEAFDNLQKLEMLTA